MKTRLIAVVVAATTLIAVGGCSYRADAGTVYSSVNSKIVVIGAGKVQISADNYWNAWYVVDKNIQTCFINLTGSMTEFDCCKLLRFKNTKEHVDWLTPEACGKPAPEPAPAS